MKEFIPHYHEHDHNCRKYAKKGARFSQYEADADAQAAFEALKQGVAEGAALQCIDYVTAADPTSGRPIELYVDASDFAWAACLCQRAEKGGAPRPCAVFSRSFTETECAWSTFER